MCQILQYGRPGSQVDLSKEERIKDFHVDTRDKEIKGLLKAASYCKAKEAWIITLDEEEELTIDGVHIQIMPAWKWMLKA